jgi:toxin secretion/phage lysis holin
VNKPVGYFMKGMVKRKMNIKDGICTAIGLCGSFIAGCFGGWDTGLVTLLIFMGIDYMSGLVVAGVFHNSNKTKTGALESRAGWKGLCRKCMTLLFVLIAYRLDLALGVNYIRDAVIIGFMANELISIVENAGLMGLPLPEVINKAIDILTQKGDEQNGQAGIH